MAVAMHYQDLIDLLAFNTRPIEAQRPEPNRMPDDSETLNTLSLGHQAGAQFNAALHNPDCQIWIGYGIPVISLVGASKDGSAPFNIEIPLSVGSPHF